MDEVRLPISSEVDIVAARQHGRALGSKLGFSSSELTLIATAISEIARNIVTYAGQGYITLSCLSGRLHNEEHWLMMAPCSVAEESRLEPSGTIKFYHAAA